MREPDAKIRAPWTPEQVNALNAFQSGGGMHPFTCAADHHGTAMALIARTGGWHCSAPTCDYRQGWAHAFMADPTGVDWSTFDQNGHDTSGCDCGHNGMGRAWHASDCAWRRGVGPAEPANSEPSGPRWAETVDTDDGGATIRIPAYAPDGSETDGLLLTRPDAVSNTAAVRHVIPSATGTAASTGPVCASTDRRTPGGRSDQSVRSTTMSSSGPSFDVRSP